MNYHAPRYLLRRFEILRRVRKGNCFLEIGPGRLQLARDLLRYFDQGVLVDFNPDTEVFFERLPANEKRRLQLCIGDFLEEIPVGASEYDCVVACEVMEHIEDEGPFLDRVFSILKEDGQLILSVPAHMRYWSVHDEIVGHYRRYEADELRRLLTNHNFQQIKVISYGFPFVNLLWILRVLLARQQRSKAEWDQKKQTQKSGLMQGPTFLKLLGLFVNKYTINLLGRFASLFNDLDFSEGYVVMAVKASRTTS